MKLVKCSMCLGSMVFILGILLCMTIFAQEQPKKKVQVVPDASLAAGGTHQYFFGKGYRNLWTTAIEVEYLDLKNFAGGLTPTGTGKGLQSLGLRFVGADGRSYSFRPIKKTLLDLLPNEFKGTFMDEIIDDQVKSAFPTAPPVVPVLLDSLDVLHNTPKIIVIPDDPLLGEYREHFAGQVGTIEEWPNEGKDGTPGFAGATEVHSTDELVEALKSDPAQRVDVHNFLTARLFDLVIGDWDRHRGQWRWANVGEGNPPAWMPIPEDRDQAFAIYDGALFGTVRIMAPQLTKFGPKYNTILGMTWNGQTVDRELLTGLDKSDWDTVVRSVQTRLDDSVIDEAFHQLPPSHYEIAAEDTADIMKIRRDKLPEVADKYYRHLAGEVDIRATDASEIVEVVRHDDGRLELSIFTIQDGEKLPTPYYHRIFDPEDTDDVRLFLNGGDDRVLISGNGPDEVNLRIISEAGQNEVTDSSKEGGTRIYDSRKQGGVTAPGVKVNQKHYTPPEPVMFQPPPRDWGNRTLWTSVLDISGDTGLLLGVGVSKERYGFRRNPFTHRWSSSLAFATKVQRFRFSAGYDVTRENSKVRGSVEFLLSGIESLNFYGYGNETSRPEDEDLAAVFRRTISLKPNIKFSLAPHWTLQVGTFLEYSETQDDPDHIAGILDPYGSGDFWQVGFLTELVYDTLDSHAWPKLGTLLRIKGDYYPQWLDIEEGDYGSLEGLLGGVYPLSEKFVLAALIGGRKVWGHYPYFQAAYVGGSRVLRGFDSERFAGDSSLYANLELRVPISRFFLVLPGEFGIYGFVDTGRVFLEGESSKKWHTGYGVGLWVAPVIRQFTMSLAIAGSDEGPRVYFRFGFGF
ncbi:MAG: BamA/TamA family outer membrane protein [Candidatus Aminicenantes bacterium]|nr:BamA/TamA family outer membrane protein [Candidatus Aminicenantes bacterium]